MRFNLPFDGYITIEISPRLQTLLVNLIIICPIVFTCWYILEVLHAFNEAYEAQGHRDGYLILSKILEEVLRYLFTGPGAFALVFYFAYMIVESCSAAWEWTVAVTEVWCGEEPW